MPTFPQKDGSKKFTMNPQVGKALGLGGAPPSAAGPADSSLGGMETPGEEAAEPTTIECPGCGQKIELTAAPVMEDQPQTDDGTQSIGDGGAESY